MPGSNLIFIFGLTQLSQITLNSQDFLCMVNIGYNAKSSEPIIRKQLIFDVNQKNSVVCSQNLHV